MKRFVTYIYEYERGERGRNVGFIRTDIRDDACRMEVHIRLGDRTDGKGMLFLVADAQHPVGIPAGELLLSQGMGHLRLTCPQNQLGKSGYTVPQLVAFAARLENGRILVGSFASEPVESVMRGEFEVWSPGERDAAAEAPQQPIERNETPGTRQQITEHDEPLQAQPQTAKHDEPLQTLPQATQTAEAMQTQQQITERLPDDSQSVDTAAPIPQDDAAEKTIVPEPGTTYERIEITDIRRLPKRNWPLCNNSFLVHGFFNYHYLILKTVEHSGQTERFLGVPGIYEQQERMMAMMFGFPEFEAAQPGDSTGTNGLFGYWMCPVSEM